MGKRLVLLFSIMLITVFPGFLQPLVAEERMEKPFSYIGMKLADVFNSFGAPAAVYASRGDEHWQDDVVFIYDEGDFFIYHDRVWQVSVKSVFGVNIGDVKAVALLVLGDTAKEEGGYILYNIKGGGWPVTIRINITAGKVSAIFVYRPDFQ